MTEWLFRCEVLPLLRAASRADVKPTRSFCAGNFRAAIACLCGYTLTVHATLLNLGYHAAITMRLSPTVAAVQQRQCCRHCGPAACGKWKVTLGLYQTEVTVTRISHQPLMAAAGHRLLRTTTGSGSSGCSDLRSPVVVGPGLSTGAGWRQL